MTTPPADPRPADSSISDRINTVLTPDSAAAMDKLQRRTGQKKVDLVNRAIMLFEYFEAAQRAGEDIVVRKPDGTECLLRFF